jgi:hypothetical protein
MLGRCDGCDRKVYAILRILLDFECDALICRRCPFVETHRWSSNVIIIIFFRPKTEEVIPRHFEAQPRGGHRGRDLEQIWADAFVHASNTLLGRDDANGVEDALVLVSHAGHGVDLESSAENVTVKKIK